MVALFAVGVITGTILSFEMGLLWPNFTATFGGVFGLGFAIEGFSFFLEAIFIGIYVYGWDRLSPRAHMLSGIPIVFTGFTGSLMVIAVNAWMNHPGGFRCATARRSTSTPSRRCSATPTCGTSSSTCTWRATSSPASSSPAPTRSARLRGRWSRYERTALVVPLTIAALASPVQVLVGDWAARDVANAADQARRDRGAGADHPRSARITCSAGTTTAGQVRHRRSRSCSRCWPSMAPTPGGGPRRRPAAERPPVNVVRIGFQTMVGIGTLLAPLGAVVLYLRVRRRRLPEWPGSTAGWSPPGRCRWSR